MPTIRISDDTWQRLKNWAVPLEDTPDDAVRKALDAAEGKVSNKRAKVTATPALQGSANRGRREGEKTPQKEFRIPLMMVVHELGGSASTRELHRVLEERLSPVLKEADYNTVSSGDPRWWNAICWERNDLVNEGLFRRDSARGIWELSEHGLRFVETELAGSRSAT